MKSIEDRVIFRTLDYTVLSPSSPPCYRLTHTGHIELMASAPFTHIRNRSNQYGSIPGRAGDTYFY
jgi:hypothetical protein